MRYIKTWNRTRNRKLSRGTVWCSTSVEILSAAAQLYEERILKGLQLVSDPESLKLVRIAAVWYVIYHFLLEVFSNNWQCLYLALWPWEWEQQQQRPFYGPLSGTTRVSWYQKKHSPTHHPDHHPIFISFFHLPRSIASSLFKLRAWQSFCTTSFLENEAPCGLQGRK